MIYIIYSKIYIITVKMIIILYDHNIYYVLLDITISAIIHIDYLFNMKCRLLAMFILVHTSYKSYD